jgi:hypothetical protein
VLTDFIFLTRCLCSALRCCWRSGGKCPLFVSSSWRKNFSIPLLLGKETVTRGRDNPQLYIWLGFIARVYKLQKNQTLNNKQPQELNRILQGSTNGQRTREEMSNTPDVRRMTAKQHWGSISPQLDWASSRTQTPEDAGDGAGKGAFTHSCWKCKLVQPLWRAAWRLLKKLRLEPPHGLVPPLLGVYLKSGSIKTLAQ